MIAHKTPETKVVIKNFQKICGLLGAPGSSPSLTFSGFVLLIFIGKEMKKIRQRLINGDRTSSPCNTCSVNGRLFANSSFDLLKNYYETIFPWLEKCEKIFPIEKSFFRN